MYWKYYGKKYSGGSAVSWLLSHRAQFITNLPLTGLISSLTVLDRFRQCKCTDERDRIYTCEAFGEISEDRLSIQPDYDRPARNVYMHFAQQTIALGTNLRLLCHVGNESPCSSGSEGLPSWVPDWSRRTVTGPIHMSFCSGLSAPSILSIGDDCLILRGMTVGAVQNVALFGMEHGDSYSPEIWREDLRTAVQHVYPNAGHDPEQDRQYIRALTENNIAEHHVPAIVDLPTMEQAERFFHHVLDSDDLSSILKEVDVPGSFAFAQGRCLFSTRNGQMGVRCTQRKRR